MELPDRGKSMLLSEIMEMTRPLTTAVASVSIDESPTNEGGSPATASVSQAM